MKLSVLVATRNRPRALARCLESVLDQGYPALEIIVLDDASAVPVAPATQALSPRIAEASIRWLRSEEQVGPAGARNRMMSEATGDVLVGLDDDAWLPEPGALARVAEAFREEETLGIVAFRIVDHVGAQERLLVPFRRRLLRKHPEVAEVAQPVSYYFAGAHAVRGDVFTRCGPFDDALVYGHEEIDLSLRTLEAGFTLRYLPGAVAYHERDPAEQANVEPGWRLRHLVRNRFRLAWRYLPARYLVPHLLGWNAFYAVTAFRQGTLAAFWKGVKEGFHEARALHRQPIGAESTRYLKQHGGRLLY